MKKSNSVDLSSAFSALRSKFSATLPARVEQMRWLGDNFNEVNGGALIAEAHKLAGACGTFGFAEVGIQARRLEQLVQALLAKPSDQQEQALPLLHSELSSFVALVKNTQLNTDNIPVQRQSTKKDSLVVWLLQDSGALLEELSAQLQAFGFEVRTFSQYHCCFEQLQRETPAVIYLAVSLGGQALFEQKSLLNILQKHHLPVLVYSDSDDFELRVKAAQIKAQAFYVSPLDTPNIVAAVTELIEQQTKHAGRIAIIEDDDILAEHYQLVLQAAGYQTYKVRVVTKMVEELLSFQPDLLLMDMYMPKFSGPELAGVLRQYKVFKRLPIVFLSSEQNKILQLQALSHGADDFMTKPIDDQLLVQSIRVRLSRALEIRSLIEKDGLTNLIKHSAIKELAALEFERSARLDKPLSIVILDIDFFKSVNDSYGHAIGDVVIATLATLLRKRIRKTDRAGRYGGEEFMLVLPECSGVKARELVELLLHAFRQVVFTAANQHFSCTFSAGVASTSDNSFSNIEAMIEAADTALYQAKQAGRNRVC